MLLLIVTDCNNLNYHQLLCCTLFQSTKADIKSGKQSATPAPSRGPPSRGKATGSLGDKERTGSPTMLSSSPTAHEETVIDKKYKEKLFSQVGLLLKFLPNSPQLYACKTNVFGGILESACLSVRLSVSVQNYSNFMLQTPTVLLQLY